MTILFNFIINMYANWKYCAFWYKFPFLEEQIKNKQTKIPTL